MGAGAALIYSREQCLSMGGRRRNSSAFVSGSVGVLATYGALSRSLLVYDHDQMQANAVSQRAVWVLVPRPLNYRLSDAVSTHAASRNGSASVSGAIDVIYCRGRDLLSESWGTVICATCDGARRPDETVICDVSDDAK